MERARRLRKGHEFDGVYAKGIVTSGPLLVARHLENSAGHPRWGFAVGKRIARKAVVRNRTRRRLREAARQLEGVVAADIVVTARRRAVDAPYAELERALRTTLRRAKLLSGEQSG